MVRVLQVYDNTGINAGINIEIMNIYRYIDHDQCTFDFLSSWKKTPNNDDEIKTLGGNSFYITTEDHLPNPIEFIRKVKRFMKCNAHKYDVLHLHAGQMCFPYLFYAKKYGIKKRIVHAHSYSYGNTRLSSMRNSLFLLPMKSLANTFIACSDEAAFNWFIKRKICNYKIITNGIETWRYTYSVDERNQLRSELGITAKTKLITHISNMSKLKNLPFLFRVYEKILSKSKDCILLLVGRDELPKEVKELMEISDFQDRIINYGITRDVSKVINGSDICLMPSINEGFGLVPIECQCCGCPVIISEGFPKIIEASDYAYRLPLNEDLWVKTVIEIINEEKEKNNLRSDMNKFDIRQVCKKMLDCYLV